MKTRILEFVKGDDEHSLMRDPKTNHKRWYRICFSNCNPKTLWKIEFDNWGNPCSVLSLSGLDILRLRRKYENS